MARILVVDDQPDIRTLIRIHMADEGHDVVEAEDAPGAVALLTTSVDLVLLDVNVPGTDGLELLRQIRRTSDLPVILVTARGGEVDRVVGLRLGADDYIVKPFSFQELGARVGAVLRRSTGTNVLVFGELTVDLRRRRLGWRGDDIELTHREFDLLSYLARQPGRAFSRAELLRDVWDSEPTWQHAATITEHVGRLRRKLDRADAPASWLRTVRGEGYAFEPNDARVVSLN
jgi:DNA-binding response OmpR family regulator